MPFICKYSKGHIDMFVNGMPVDVVGRMGSNGLKQSSCYFKNRRLSDYVRGAPPNG